ncbi:S8/S53 family peptidase [Nisaea nitritireducens]|uniref:hypothetical protein n=1 Tax=Nisaea nitritireducens TaxID=568392 RepID=UPI0018688635|nr:hypothetical protein [Nisaea nitritireducens]
MTRNLNWEIGGTHPSTSSDPYGHWTRVSGKDFLVDFRPGKKPYRIVLERQEIDRSDPDKLYLPFAAILDGKSLVPVIQREVDVKAEAETRLPRAEPTPGVDGTIFPVPLPESTLNETGTIADPKWCPPARCGKTPAIVAVIDDGIAFPNRRFQLPDSESRVEYAWIQDAPFDRKRNTVPFGREYRRDEIDTVLAEHEEEDDILREFGLADLLHAQQPSAFKHASHGTAVLDLAGGYDLSQAEIAENVRLITVQLPGIANWDGSGSVLGWFVAWGVQYILQRARLIEKELGMPVPVFINLSYGLSGGPHDGTHWLELIVEHLLENHRKRSDCPEPPKPDRIAELVTVTGNDFLRRRHASIKAASKGSVTLDLPWRVPPGDPSSSALEVWLPADATGIQVDVTSPSGPPLTAWPPQQPDPGAVLRSDLCDGSKDPQNVIAQLSLEDPYWAGPKKRVTLIVAPTDTDILDTQRPPAPSGLWQIAVTATVKKGQSLTAWVQREELPLGYPNRGGSGYLDDPENPRFTSPGDWSEHDYHDAVVRRFGSLSGTATGYTSLVIGGYRDGDRRLALYSGASSPETTTKLPTALLPSDCSRVLAGILTTGNRSGATFSLTGTSAAGPLAVRMLAERVGKVENKGAIKVLADLAAAGEKVIGGEPKWAPNLDTRPADRHPIPRPVTRGPELRAGEARILFKENTPTKYRLDRPVTRGRITERD